MCEQVRVSLINNHTNMQHCSVYLYEIKVQNKSGSDYVYSSIK